MDLGEHAGINANGYLSELLNISNHDWDSFSAKRQQWPDMQHSTPSFIHTFEALGAAATFHSNQFCPQETTRSDSNIQMEHDIGTFARSIYGTIGSRTNGE
jgi:hypothetical protein